jgi:hypothetical protein
MVLVLAVLATLTGVTEPSIEIVSAGGVTGRPSALLIPTLGGVLGGTMPMGADWAGSVIENNSSSENCVCTIIGCKGILSK